MDKKSLFKLELNKILASVAEYAALEKSKALILAREPSTDLAEVRRRLDITEECDKLLYVYGAGESRSVPRRGRSAWAGNEGLDAVF